MTSQSDKMKNSIPKKIVFWAAMLSILAFHFIANKEDSNLDLTLNLECPSLELKETKPTYAMPPDAIEQFLQMTANPKLQKRTPENLLKVRSQMKSGHYKLAKRAEITSWEERGPINVAGRTRTLLVDANDTSGNTVWAGSVSGGLWKTINFQSEEVTWSPINDFFQNIAVSSIAQDPAINDVMYFGTGVGWCNADAIRGLGFWKTENGGQSWNQLSSTNNDDFSYIQKVVVDTQGSIYAGTKNEGIQKSVNGGLSWTKVLGGTTGGAFSNRAADIEIASNGDIYASLGIFSPDGIYKSTDGGATWTDLIRSAPNNGLPNEGFERIEIATAPSNENVVYALFQSDKDLDCMGIYRTDDGGITWTSLPVPSTSTDDNFTRNQAWYDLIAQVDPINEHTVYIGGIDLLRSIDGGETWTAISHWYGAGNLQNVHADQHSIQFYPGDNLRAVIGNDGGVYSLNIDLDKQIEPSYCAVDHSGLFNDFITNVDLNSISNQTGSGISEDAEGYSDYTDISTTLTAGDSFTISFTTNNSFDVSKAGAWIDWNGDYEFGPEEQILNASGMQPYQASFIVPNDAAHISTRLRVRMQYGPEYIPDPCASSGFVAGETEDYTIVVENCTEGTSCNDQDNCTINDILDSLCNCAGVFFDLNEDNLCDYFPIPEIIAKNNNYNVTQFYSCAIHPDPGSNAILGGTQDNGTQLFSSAGLNSTAEVTGGDGGFCFIDQDQPNIHISTYVYNTFHITSDSWGEYETISIGNNAGYFINPMDYDSKSNTLLSSYNPGYLARIRNVGAQNIADTIGLDELDLLKISAIKVDPNVENRVWVASVKESTTADTDSKARIIAIDNANLDAPTIGKVVEISNEQFEGSAYTRVIEIYPNDPLRMIILFSNFGVPNLWMTDDGGESWSNVDGNLPDFPVFWVMFNPLSKAGAIVATEMGIWSTDKLDGENTQWKVMNEGLANVRVDMLKYRPSDQTLVAATHGRGIFTTTLFTNCDSLELTAEIIHATCSGDQDGSIFFEDQNFTYSWSTGADGPALDNLSTGTYHVTISSGDSCHYVQSYSIETQSNMIVSDLIITDVSCLDQNDGSIAIEVSGGIGTLTYNWSDGQMGDFIDGLSSGEYVVTVTDDENCEITSSVTVLTNTLDVVVEQVSANEAIATPLGGTSPYLFQWSDDSLQTTQLARGLEHGNYSVTLTDANDCMVVGNIEITEIESEDLKLWDIIASAGQSFTSDNLQVDWTIGEILVEQRINNALNLSEGFHQMFRGENSTMELPDFTVESLDLADSQAFLGQNLFSITYTLSNIGTAALPEQDILRTKIYLSLDTIIDETDLDMSADLKFDVPIGYSQIITNYLNFNTVQTPGEYYIIVKVNDDERIVESDYSNNTIFTHIVILDPNVNAPDFEVISFSTERNIFFPGEFLFDGGTVIIRNSGTLATPSDFSGVYLSKDETIDFEDPFVGFASYDVLQPGQLDTISFSINLDDNLLIGDYYLLLCLDELEVIIEILENNNCASEQIKISDDSDRPDLIISELDFRYDEYFPGDRALPFVHLLNTGNSPAFSGFMSHSIYISNDMTPTEDEKVRTFFTFEDFLPGQPIVEDVLLTFDQSLAPGSYYIIGEVDSGNRILEANEENNLFVTEINIRDTTLLPDLVVSSATISNTPVVGGTLESSVTLSNIGDYKITESILGIYFTKEDTLGAEEIRINTMEVPSIEAGQSVQVNISFDIPSTLDPGLWNVIFAGDAFFRRFESNEDNNTFLIKDVSFGSLTGASFRQKSDDKITLFPNPTRGNLFIQRSDDFDYQFEIVMPNGKRIDGGTLKANNELQTSAFSPGLYWLILKEEKGERRIFPFIKM